MKRLFLAAAFATGLALLPASVAAATTVGISGYEVFPGFPCAPSTTCGATFLGFTTTSPGWWYLSLNYSGIPKTTTGITVQSGRWAVAVNGRLHSGGVSGGTVTWGASPNVCPATVILNLTGGGTGAAGLLDDCHFPPRVSGTVDLTP
jgi:hypothetical protein